MAKYESLIGKKFNMLTVVGLSTEKLNKQPGWICKCDCGGEKTVTRYHLTKGAVKSCGCLIKYDETRFAEDARKIHGDFYDYSKVRYTGSQDFVTIVCPIHEEFEQRVAIHLSGSGCQKCAAIRMGAAHAVTVDEFDAKAREVRADSTYDLADYTLSTEAMPFVCKTHGTRYMQKPTAYLAGNQGCEDCRGKMRNRETFIEKAESIHGKGTYNYSLVDYKKSKVNVTIICSVGHVFQQTPHNHTAGKHGCPSCGPCGFDARKDSWLYILSAEGMSKLGITNRDALKRAKSIAKSAGFPFKVEAEYKLEGQFCSDLESKLLRQYRLCYQNPTPAFQGSSECFMGLSVETIKSDIAQCVEKEYDKTKIRPGLGDTQDVLELQE